MVFLVLLAMLVLFGMLPRWLGRGSGDARTQLLTKGLPARGLILRAASTGSSTLVNGQRFQVRSVSLDVEVPGRAPYEISLNALFPRLCESFPGTALDLRVDPSNPNNVAVIGPVGTSAWIGAAPWLMPQGLPTAGSSGCAWIVMIVAALGLAGGAVASFVGNGSETSTPSHPEPPSTPAHTAPTATPYTIPTLQHPTTPQGHRDCEAAARCCKILGRSHCVFATSTDAACKTALDEEQRAAAKAGKVCK